MDYTISKKKIDAAFDYVRKKLFSERTLIIYDSIVLDRESDFPSVEEILDVYPNPCGYSTGMEDGMICGATMLDVCLLRYEREKDDESAEFAKKILNGMLGCASSAKSEGFLPRAVALSDGKTHYPDSSIDQYTMFAFAMHRYLRSGLCTSEEKADIKRAVLAIAHHAEKNVTPENGYDMLTDDGMHTLVTVMWGENRPNHERHRLPMIYILAYSVSGDTHWLERYRAIRDFAYEKALPMTRYWCLYTLQQMQASVLVCSELDPDEGWHERYISLMNEVADYAESLCEEKRTKIASYSDYNAPQLPFRELNMEPREAFIKLGYKNVYSPSRRDYREFFTLQDGAQVAIVAGMVPGRAASDETVRLLADSFARIDIEKHERNLPVYFLDGYYRGLRRVHGA